MSAAAVLTPVFVQVILTLVLMVMMARARFEAGRALKIRYEDMALGQNVWPEKPAKLARAFHNQFETPVLFYAAVGFALASGVADRVFVALEWAFVLMRVAHAAVHVGSNHIPTRFRMFFGAICALIALWVWLAVRVLGA